MQPIVLAWALLFVVAFGIVYRFFAWLGRRFGQRPSAVEIPQGAKESLAKAVAAPVVHAQAQVTPVSPPVTVQPPPAAAPAARPVARPGQLPASALDATSMDAPRPAPASHYAAPQPSGPSSAVMSARAAAAAAAAPLRSAIAPSVEATLAPRQVFAPSLTATLAPRPAAAVAAPIAIIPSPASVPMPIPAREVAAVAAVAATAPALSPTSPATNASAGGVSSLSADEEKTLPTKSPSLRARKIGEEPVSLDARIKASRSRKTLPSPRASRKPSELAATKEMKVLAQKPAPKKTPTRRINRKAEHDIVLTSAKATTRIVGVPQRAPRVLVQASV